MKYTYRTYGTAKYFSLDELKKIDPSSELFKQLQKRNKKTLMESMKPVS